MELECPECGAIIELDEDETEIGQEIECPECGTILILRKRGKKFFLEPLEEEELEEADEDEDETEAEEEDY